MKNNTITRKVWVLSETCNIGGELVGSPDAYMGIDDDGDPRLSDDVCEISGTDAYLLAYADALDRRWPYKPFNAKIAASIRKAIDMNIDYAEDWAAHVASCR